MQQKAVDILNKYRLMTTQPLRLDDGRGHDGQLCQ